MTASAINTNFISTVPYTQRIVRLIIVSWRMTEDYSFTLWHYIVRIQSFPSCKISFRNEF